MIVLDASAVIEWLLQTPIGQRIENRIYRKGESLHAPHLLDVEVAHAMRRLERDGKITGQRADQAIDDLLVLRITRYPHVLLLPQLWRHRHNLSAYDAAYVALAEEISAPLVTHDLRLASAKGHAAKIEAF